MKKDSGQIIVMVAAGIFVLAAFAALVIDGGMIFLTRREMQTAADSAAIAASSVYCGAQKKNANQELNAVGDAVEEGEYYAEYENGADDSNVYQIFESQFYASATKSIDTFFAGLFGNDVVTISAEAAAMCGPATVGLTNLLPIAFACKNTVGSIISEDPSWDPSDPDIDCQYNAITKDTLTSWKSLYGNEDDKNLLAMPPLTPQNPLLLSEMFIVLDSSDLRDSTLCVDPEDPMAGYFGCDFDGDGGIDNFADSSKGWMDLDGNEAGKLTDWLIDGFDAPLQYHTWFETIEGLRDVDYHIVDGFEGETVLLPVFDYFCDGDAAPDCVEAYWHDVLWNDIIAPDHDTWIGYPFKNGEIYYHVITFVEFYITCAYDGGNDSPCPGGTHIADYLFENDYGDGASIYQMQTLEGYILQGSSSSVGTNPNTSGTDSGTYSVYLVPID